MTDRSANAAMEALKAEHTPEAIRERLSDGPRHSYLRDFIYGAVDGTVTTFAVVSGVAGAGLGSGVVLILGAANLVGDGFSMAVSNYLGTKAEDQLRQRAMATEHQHIDHYPEGEREEIRQLFEQKGFQGEALESAVDIVTANRQVWVETMVREEHGLALEGPSPWRAAAITFMAFCLVGLIPLLAFIVQYFAPNLMTGAQTYLWSTVMTGVAFFGTGTVKGRFVGHSWYISGLETLAMGAAAAGLAYTAGWLLRGVAGAG